MIYRGWSLLSSTVAIWGGAAAAAAGISGVVFFGGKEKFQDFLCREGKKLRNQDKGHDEMISAADQTIKGPTSLETKI